MIVQQKNCEIENKYLELEAKELELKEGYISSDILDLEEKKIDLERAFLFEERQQQELQKKIQDIEDDTKVISNKKQIQKQKILQKNRILENIKNLEEEKLEAKSAVGKLIFKAVKINEQNNQLHNMVLSNTQEGLINRIPSSRQNSQEQQLSETFRIKHSEYLLSSSLFMPQKEMFAFLDQLSAEENKVSNILSKGLEIWLFHQTHQNLLG